MRVRTVTLQDIIPILKLASQLGYQSGGNDLRQRFEALERKGEVGLFVGEIDGQVCGFMQLHVVTTMLSGSRVELDALIVDEKFRNQGLGKSMIEFAENWSREKGLEKLRLGCRTSRTEAHKFYENCGFEIEKTWHVFVKPITSEVI